MKLPDLDHDEFIPLPPKIGRLGVYSGVTVMGDGSALLILDASGLARAVGVEKPDVFRVEAEEEPDITPPAPVVLFRTLDGRMMATQAALDVHGGAGGSPPGSPALREGVRSACPRSWARRSGS